MIEEDTIIVGIIIPTTTKGTNYTSVNETSLYKECLPSFIKTTTSSKYNLDIKVYIGYDYDDPIMVSKKEQEKLMSNLEPLDFNFIEFDNSVDKGHLTKMWNILFKNALNDKCEYFFQCGDDVKFLTNGWLDDSITALQKNNNIGISGPRNNNLLILTQALFHKTHYDIFNKFLDENNILNYYLDDWYNLIYSPNNVYVLDRHYAVNLSGPPRYKVNYKIESVKKSVKVHKDILIKYKKNIK